jgi:3-deoxy-D-manno-octulosonate 8-phosphate phosphatase (KDO 8-P phosphatase)
MGDDIGDLPVLCQAGLAITVKDSWLVKTQVDYVTQATGGHGAVREIADLLLRAHGGRKVSHR